MQKKKKKSLRFELESFCQSLQAFSSVFKCFQFWLVGNMVTKLPVETYSVVFIPLLSISKFYRLNSGTFFCKILISWKKIWMHYMHTQFNVWKMETRRGCLCQLTPAKAIETLNFLDTSSVSALQMRQNTFVFSLTGDNLVWQVNGIMKPS